MPYCTKCVSIVGENDKFCPKCGQVLTTQPTLQTSYPYRNFPLKQSTNLSNGVIIGSGISLLIVGLLMAFSLNAIFSQQTNYLAAEGVQVSRFGFGLDNVVFLISLGVIIAIMGIYLLILGSIAQFSPTVRAAWERKDSRARLGNGLISGGFVFASFPSVNILRHLYFPSNSALIIYVNVAFVIIGLLMILFGALLIRSSYLRNRFPTKV